GKESEKVDIERRSVLQFLAKAKAALEATLRQNRRSDGLWHSYNVLDIRKEKETLEVERLSLMLEGQVAILSAGLLDSNEALEVMESLPTSGLWTERHQTYLLYLDRETIEFLKSNRVDSEKIDAIPTLAKMAETSDERLVVPDPECGFRFHASLTNGYALKDALDKLAGESEFTDQLVHDRSMIEKLYEEVLNHRSFTGRSGTMFGYEGLGCVYWHMVSKLMVAVQEVAKKSFESHASEEQRRRLAGAYYHVQRGLGYRKSALDYGAFPAEPYSHSPAHAGAQQPGLTGHVKESLLCRFGELGISFADGCLSFRPYLLRSVEFDGLDVEQSGTELARDTLSFTIAGTPVNFRRVSGIEDVAVVVSKSDGTQKSYAGGVIDGEVTSEIVRRSGNVSGIEVEIPSERLVG
ncbi:MAG: hypothetical protein AAGA58_19550, partial [Verrucomicrobiota bacterium]